MHPPGAPSDPTPRAPSLRVGYNERMTTRFGAPSIVAVAWFGVALVAVPETAEAQPQFEANEDGYVVMEMESVPLGSDSEWSEESVLPEATGGAYYRYTGNNICSGPPGSPLRYSFRIHDAGTYELRLRAARIWHCVLGMPEGADNRCGESDRTCDSLGEPTDDACPASDQCIRTDISNDAFVHVETAGGEYVEFIGQPGGSVGDPIKLFGGANNAWGWTGRRALDISGKHDAQWVLPAGDYTLVVHGRSQSFRIDRMVFFDADEGSISGVEDFPETRLTSAPTDAGAGADAGPPLDSGAPTGSDAGSATPIDGGPTGPDAGIVSGSEGCSCRAGGGGGGGSPVAPALLLAIVWAGRRGRRRP